jgi:hypothetical protein
VIANFSRSAVMHRIIQGDGAIRVTLSCTASMNLYRISVLGEAFGLQGKTKPLLFSGKSVLECA